MRVRYKWILAECDFIAEFEFYYNSNLKKYFHHGLRVCCRKMSAVCPSVACQYGIKTARHVMGILYRSVAPALPLVLSESSFLAKFWQGLPWWSWNTSV